MIRGTPGLFLGAVIALIAKVAGAAGTCLPGAEVGRLISMIGDVRINGVPPVGELPFVPMCAGDLVTVGTRSRAGIYLLDADTPVRLDQDTVARIEATSTPDSGLFNLTRGAIYFLSQVRRTLTIRTPYVNAGIEGTEVYLRVREAAAELIVLEGRVALAPGVATTAPFAPATVATGEQAAVSATGAVERTTLPSPGGRFGALREVAVGALSWTLFYPDVLTEADAAQFPRIAQAARLLAAGQVGDAEAVLAAVPATGPEAGLAAALRAIIAVGRKDAAAAPHVADRAVALAPASPVPRLALSYARQLALDLDGAFAAAEEAARLGPDEPLPQARLAEIHLMRGETRQARRAADEAVRLGGGPLAQTVLGFAELAALRAKRGEAAFRHALERESWNPLALLGLGLAQIKQGDLRAGTVQIENAVTHDPGSSLLRSYLGKAYFEERRDGPAGTQYAIAKELDPTDPTPWLYDAIRLQLDNRPVSALRDLTRSMELNDNRALFRSRLLLDRDEAARGASLARVFQDLGYLRVAVDEGTRAIQLDPGNAAAHRFLADAYASLPRYQIAQVSERLQAQMLQSINVTPVQPTLAVADLISVAQGGPAAIGFNEFNPLFVRDQLQLNLSGNVGNNDTYSDEVVVSGILGRASGSFGQFYGHSDGFRANNDAREKIYNGFGQIALTEELNIQGEYIRRDTKEGDLRLQFDPDDFDPNQRVEVDETTARVGLRYSPDSGQDILASVIHADGDFEINGRESKERGPQGELQHILRWPRFNLVSGGLASEIDIKRSGQSGIYRDNHAYAYATLDGPNETALIVGVGAGKYRDDIIELDKFEVLPKLGATWQLSEPLRLRVAAFAQRKPKLLVNRSLEPTSIAGFNQFFDDPNGTRADRFGIGADYTLSPARYIGADFVYGRLDIPAQDVNENSDIFIAKQSASEYLFRSYFNFALSDEWVLNLGAEAELIESNTDAQNGVDRLRTVTMPINVRYFHPSGLFASVGGTFLFQDLRRPQPTAGTSKTTEDNDSLLLDASVGYRLPRRIGIVALEGFNLLDKEFKYRDDNFRATKPPTTRFIPSRTVLLRATVNF